MRELRFLDHRIDLNGMTLFRGDTKIPIGRKTLDALLLLIEHEDQIVSHETLRRKVWRSARISPSTIPMCIMEIRKALGDNASTPCLIASVKGRGYRFIGGAKLHQDPATNDVDSDDLGFVGRRSAIDTLRSLTRFAVTTMQGTLASIIGEAGSGKSRLVSEFVHLASHQVDSIVAKTNAMDDRTAYSIWIQALRMALEKFPKNPRLAECARHIALVLPELEIGHNKYDQVGQNSRSGFFLHWANAFKAIPRDRPLLVVLEDLHHADDDSILLLDYMATELTSSPIILIATTRPSLTLRENVQALGRLFGSADATSIRLLPFTVDEIESLIQSHREDRRSFAADILSRTGGNAFFVTHLVRLHNRHPDRIQQLPTDKILEYSAHEIVSRQLSDLPLLTRQVLCVGAVVGTRFKASLVAGSMRIPIAQVFARLEPARAARIIESEAHEFYFCHSLLRDLLYRSISQTDRSELHAAVARALEETAANANPPSVIFHHLREAFPTVSIDRLRISGLMAAAWAMSRFAYHEATRILQSTLELLAESPGVDPTYHLEVMIELADSLLYSGNRPLSRSLLIEGSNLAREVHSPTHLAECALGMAPDFLSIEVGAYDPDVIMLLKESLDQLPNESLALRSRVLARLSQMSAWSCSVDNEYIMMADEALTSARKSGDADAIIAALAARADASPGPDRTDERIQRILELQDATLTRSDVYSFLLQQTRLIAALLEKGEVRRLSIENDRYRKLAEETGLSQYRWYPISTDSMLACLAGDIELADQHAARYREIAGQSPDQNYNQTFACQYALREIERDHSHAVLPLAEEFARTQKAVFSWSAATAWIQWDSGLYGAARETLRQFSESDIRKLYREPGGTIGLAALAEVSAYIGEKSQVRLLFDIIAPISHTFATAGYGVAYFGTMARYSSILATALRQQKYAIQLAELAVQQESFVRSKSWIVYAMLDRVRALEGSLEIRWAGRKTDSDQLKAMLSLKLPRAGRCIRQALNRSSSDLI